MALEAEVEIVMDQCPRCGFYAVLYETAGILGVYEPLCWTCVQRARVQHWIQ